MESGEGGGDGEAEAGPVGVDEEDGGSGGDGAGEFGGEEEPDLVVVETDEPAADRIELGAVEFVPIAEGEKAVEDGDENDEEPESEEEGDGKASAREIRHRDQERREMKIEIRSAKSETNSKVGNSKHREGLRGWGRGWRCSGSRFAPGW